MADIIPLEEAVRRIDAKTPIGSTLRSRDWEDVPLELRERAQFSAGVTSARLLQAIQDRISGEVNQRREVLDRTGLEDGVEATFDRSSFIDAIREIAREEGLTPEKGQGTITDITSIPRLGMIYDMQNQMATGYARWKMDQSEGALLLYPAWRLVRERDAKVPRNWRARWNEAGDAVGWEGASQGTMVALKTSTIWAKLSRFGTPWPPFDFNSGMGVEDVDRDEAIALGLLKEDEIPEATGVEDFNQELEASTSGLSDSLVEKLKEAFGSQVEISDGKVAWRSGGNAPAVEVKKELPTKPAAMKKKAEKPVFEELLKEAKFSEAIVKASKEWNETVRGITKTAKIKAQEGGAYYMPGTKTIHMSADPNTWSGAPMTLNHEAGHHLHMELGIVTETSVNPDFQKAMDRDLREWRKLAKGLHGDDWKAKFKPNQMATVVEMSKMSGIGSGDVESAELGIKKRISRYSDTVMGLSHGAYGAGHAVAYMKKKGPMEVFAHAFSALQDGDEAFQKAFPNVVAFVKKALNI